MISGGGGSPGRKSKGASQDFDLNLAPIIDCITVLIAFILISTSFISIGLLDAGIATETAQQEVK
jgi:biopolymer transport protein ExbD